MNIKKISESEILSCLRAGADLLSPLIITDRQDLGRADRADARIEVRLPESTDSFHFVVEAKAQSTPLAVRNAVAQVKAYSTPDAQPMIIVPYLSPERLADLEREKVSGIDLCGNGLVIVPSRLYVLRTGQPNSYRDSRALSNPYRGRSAMVARMLLMRPRWDSLGDLRSAIREAGAELSLSQTSKAVQSMEEDMMLSKIAGTITLREPLRVLDKLGTEWRKPRVRARQALRFPSDTDWARALSSNPLLKWTITGESSVTRYTMFSQGGARCIAVSSLSLALALLGGISETVPNFADLELIETDDPGLFFGNEIDENGTRWASRLQTWLELQSGDARQQNAARDLRDQILKEV